MSQYILKLITNTIVGFCSLLGILFIFLPNVHALSLDNQEYTIRVSPLIIPLSLSPQKTIKHEILIENLSNKPYPIRINFSDFISTEDGGYVFPEKNTSPLLSWISAKPTEFILSPKAKQKILLTITTPKNIPFGGYYGMLFFEPVLPISNTQSTQIISRVGVLLLGNVGVVDEKAQKAQILTFRLPYLIFDPKTTLLFRVKNISLHHFTGKPILSLSPLFGEKTKQFLEEKIVFPGKIRRWEIPIEISKYPLNFVKVKLDLSTGGGNIVTAQSFVVVFPFTTLLIITIIFLLAFLALKRRHQLIKALHILISKNT